MFGYLRPHKGELKTREFDLYKSVYCGLCRHLGHDYGVVTRLTLSYDCTMLTMLSMSLLDECPSVHKGRCVVNPAKKCYFCSCEGKSFYLSGAVSVIMTWYKCQDTIHDGGFFSGLGARLFRSMIKRGYKKAKAAFPELDRRVSAMMEQQLAAEGDGCGIDRAADPTASLLSWLCTTLSEKKEQQKVLEQFGYYLGRWIYLIDAADDLEKDIKSGAFNPFCNALSDTNGSTMLYCNDVLNMTAARMIQAYELLELGSFKEILDNVVYHGLSLQQRYCLFEKKKDKKHRKKCKRKNTEYYGYLSGQDSTNHKE